VNKPRKSQGNAHWSKDGLIREDYIAFVSHEIEEDDDAHPDDVRAVMTRALQALENGEQLPPFRYLRLCLARYLTGSLKLDQAFGLAKVARDRPINPRKRRIEIACAMLERYITTDAGLTEAARIVGDEYGMRAARVLALLDSNFKSASASLGIRRRKMHPDWTFTPSEDRRFQQLYRRNRNQNRRLPGKSSLKSPQ
jgi:hypothetical protein